MIISLILLSVVLLSASVAFAATDDVTADVNDEISIDDEVLAIDNIDELESTDESAVAEDILSADESSNVVTKDTFYNYFDESGTLLANVTSNELTFDGDFSNVGVNNISIDRAISLTGKNATFSGVNFVVLSNDVVIDGFNLNMDNSDISTITVSDVSNVTISNNNINFKALEDSDSYAIYASDVDNFKLLNNVITYVGTTGTKMNNAVRVTGELKKSTNVTVEGNTFDITIPSAAVGYDEMYNSISYTDGMSFYACDGLTIKNNDVSLNYNGVVGSWDTIHVLTVGGSNFDFDEDYETIYPYVCSNVIISDNKINANGHSYIYGIYGAMDKFEIKNNNLNITSDVHYVDAIGIDGPSSNGVVSENTIDLTAPNLVFGIYSNPYMGAVENVSYVNNTITGNAYAACGMEIVNENPIISKNTIILTGNHTTGIVANMNENGTVEGNVIQSLGSNIGTDATGDGMVHEESTGISVKGDTLISNNNVYSTAIGVNLILGGEINLENNNIHVVAEGNTSNYAIYADGLDSLTVQGNNVTFVGITEGEQVSNGVCIVDIEGALFTKNTFDLTLVSSFVPWDAYWVPHPVSEGIVVDASDKVTFDGNTVIVGFDEVVGSFDTIYSIDFKNSNNAVVTNNDITSTGNTYIYGVLVSGDDFIIRANNITSTGNYYANGIDVEGPASGVIEYNLINVKANTSAYAIYSGMNGADVKANYTGNDIVGGAYNIFGMSLGDVESNIINNTIDLAGNYTTGIAYRGSVLSVINNNISAKGSNVGNQSIWENFGVESIGIKVVQGNTTIENNNIQTTGDYAVKLNNNNATLTDNYLASKKGAGNTAISGVSNAVISGSSPELKTIISAPILYTEYVYGVVFPVTLQDENGDPVVNATIFAVIDGVKYNETTDDMGYAAFVPDLNAGSYDVLISYDGNDTYGPKSTTSKIIVDVSATEIVAPASKSVLLTAVKSGSYVTLTLKDMNDNWLGGKQVSITFNGKTKTYTTSELGVIKFKLAATKTGTYTLKMKFAGDNNYVGSDASTTVKITKEATKVTAKAKTFKAKTKTKKYTITLKDSKGKAIKKVKVTIKVGKKTFKATTNAKGKATFKITKLTKKGTYKSTVKFAGNAYYKAVKKSVKITVIK